MNLQISGSFLQTLRRTAREAIIFTLLGPIVVTLGYLALQAYNAPSAAPHTKPKMCTNYLSTLKTQNIPSSTPIPIIKKGWARAGAGASIYKRCHFEGYDACFNAGIYGSDSIVTLHDGDQVKLLSKETRASDGSEIYEAQFQHWTGWINVTDFGFPLPPGSTVVFDPSEIATTDATEWIAQQETIPCMAGAQEGDQLQADKPMFDGLHTIRFKQDMYVQTYDGTWMRFPNGWETPTNRIERVVNHISLSDYIHPKDGVLAGVIFGWPFGFAVWLAYRILRFAIKG